MYDDILSEDFRYQNRPLRAIYGTIEFGTWMREYAAVTTMNCEIVRIAEVGNWVLTERADSWTVDGVAVACPLMGSSGVDDVLRIASWKDYVPYSAEWEASGQMRPGFFTDWADRSAAILS